MLELEYFDPIRMTILDPMHNLFLGTAKRCFNLWRDFKIINDEGLGIIQERIESTVCPTDVGKFPQNVASSFGSFNADQWKSGLSCFQFLP